MLSNEKDQKDTKTYKELNALALVIISSLIFHN